jgi:dolichol-phosphate mannosyltransferase
MSHRNPELPIQPVPSGASEGRTTLTVIVPVYNEAATVRAAVDAARDQPCVAEVIVVDDGSTDGTCAALADGSRDGRVKVVVHAVNRGKGAAIRTGLELACGLFTVIQDADLEYDPAEYPKLLEPLVAGRADVVYGSRYLRGTPSGERFRAFRYGVAVLNLAVRVLYGVRLTDEATCYKLFPTEVLRTMDLQCERFEFCPEVTAKACRMGLRIVEVPITYRSRARSEGKKLRWQDGWQALRCLWRWRRWQPPSDEAGSSPELQTEAEAALARPER